MSPSLSLCFGSGCRDGAKPSAGHEALAVPSAHLQLSSADTGCRTGSAARRSLSSAPALPPHGRVSEGEGRKAARAHADMDL